MSIIILLDYSNLTNQKTVLLAGRNRLKAIKAFVDSKELHKQDIRSILPIKK